MDLVDQLQYAPSVQAGVDRNLPVVVRADFPCDRDLSFADIDRQVTEGCDLVTFERIDQSNFQSGSH